ncbi:hypothetical protein HDE_06148 [Halotydeus destructor]|nr:hypothetical protein HDE_06148 [Halotydeus destructor]
MAGTRPTWTLLVVTSLCAVVHVAQSADVKYSHSVNFSYHAPREEDMKKLMPAKIMSAGKISRPEGDDNLDGVSGSKQSSILSLLNAPSAPPTGDGIASTRRKRESESMESANSGQRMILNQKTDVPIKPDKVANQEVDLNDKTHDTSKLEIFSEGEPVTIERTLQKNPDKSLYVEIEIPQPRQVSLTWSFRDTKDAMRSERSLDENDKFCVQFILSQTDGSEPIKSGCLSPEDAEEPLDFDVDPEKEYRISSRIIYFKDNVPFDPDASDEFETIDLATAITRKQDTVPSTEPTDPSTATTVTSPDFTDSNRTAKITTQAGALVSVKPRIRPDSVITTAQDHVITDIISTSTMANTRNIIEENDSSTKRPLTGKPFIENQSDCQRHLEALNFKVDRMENELLKMKESVNEKMDAILNLLKHPESVLKHSMTPSHPNFHVSHVGLSYEDANDYCAQLGASLPILGDVFERKWLTDTFLSKGENMWLSYFSGKSRVSYCVMLTHDDGLMLKTCTEKASLTVCSQSKNVT